MYQYPAVTKGQPRTTAARNQDPDHCGLQEKPGGEVTLTCAVVQGPNRAGDWEGSSLWTIVPKRAGPAEGEPRRPVWNSISGSPLTVVPSRTQTCRGRTEGVAVALGSMKRMEAPPQNLRCRQINQRREVEAHPCPM